MTLLQALSRELDRGMAVIAVVENAPCQVCDKTDELRAGTCFNCKDKIETDMIEVWEIANPLHRWPYVYRGKFRDVGEADVQQFQKLTEDFNNGGKKK